MATVKNNPAVTETKVVEVTPPTITVTLTPSEAQTLRAIVSRVNIAYSDADFILLANQLWEGSWQPRTGPQARPVARLHHQRATGPHQVRLGGMSHGDRNP